MYPDERAWLEYLYRAQKRRESRTTTLVILGIIVGGIYLLRWFAQHGGL